jgi:RNA polymerase sigma-70 factor (ECF subfamily)
MLFRRYARVANSIGRRILRDNAEAEDIVQEVFLYVCRRSILFDSSKGSARSWIIQISYTQAFLRRRQLKSHGFYTSGNEDRSFESDSVASSGADYDHTVEGLFGRNAWRRVLDALTEEQRETLRLHFFEGYTFAEIAEKLGQSYANVRNHHYRGLEKLRKHLGEDELNGR